MPRLVIKEKIGLKRLQEWPLRQSSKKHRFVDLNMPIHQGANSSFMRRGASSRNQRRADTNWHISRRLKPLKCSEKWHEWSRW